MSGFEFPQISAAQSLTPQIQPINIQHFAPMIPPQMQAMYPPMIHFGPPQYVPMIQFGPRPFGPMIQYVVELPKLEQLKSQREMLESYKNVLEVQMKGLDRAAKALDAEIEKLSRGRKK